VTQLKGEVSIAYFIARDGTGMKRVGLVLFGVVALLGATAAVRSKQTFRGEVMDTQCAKMGSHDVMMKKEGARNAVECTRDCSKMGGKYVLYDPVARVTYHVDDQKKLEPFVGQNVEISGAYDGAVNTIHVAGVERRASSSLSSKK